MRLRPRTIHASWHILRRLLFFLIALPTLSFASCADCTSHSIKERHQVPDGWIFVRRAPLHSEIQLQIGLKQGRFRELERHLNEGELVAHLFRLSKTTRALANVLVVYSVSDPSHIRYGRHLTADEAQRIYFRQSTQSSGTKEADHPPSERPYGRYPNTCMPISNPSSQRAHSYLRQNSN